MTEELETTSPPALEPARNADGTGLPGPDRADAPPEISVDAPEVGLSQKGTGEEAVIRRETEI
jgi:hypothetical protein